MSTTTLKILQRAALASLLLVAVTACSNVAPDPQIANAAIATQNSGG